MASADPESTAATQLNQSTNKRSSKANEQGMMQWIFKGGEVEDGFKRVAGSPKRLLLYQEFSGTRPGLPTAGGRGQTLAYVRIRTCAR